MSLFKEHKATFLFSKTLEMMCLLFFVLLDIIINFTRFHLHFFLRADDPTKKPKSIVDVGCGIGGSSRYLAKKYGAECRGITLSPVQAERGNALAAAQGLSDKVASNLHCRMNCSNNSILETLITSPTN
jgi:2-polyprenyl-3-methyl-5-hydroxy-6-metoxy-1,4-benzoquinol methylase